MQTLDGEVQYQDAAYPTTKELREEISHRVLHSYIERNMTLEEFVKTYPNDTINIMSPGGFVTIRPNFPLEQLEANLGERGTEIPISWNGELKGQTVEQFSYDKENKTWSLLSAWPEKNYNEKDYAPLDDNYLEL